MNNEYIDDDFDDDHGELVVVPPEMVVWRNAAYLHLMPYDATQSEKKQAGKRSFLMPISNTTVRYYSVEVVYRDDTWDFVYYGKSLGEAKSLINKLAAGHDLRIEKNYPARSDVAGY